MQTKPNAPYHIVPMEEEHARSICSWRYAPPFSVYDWDAWEKLREEQKEFADPEIRAAQYVSVIDKDGELAGFAQLFPIAGVTRIGLAMRPDRCGQGLGLAFVRTVIAEARRRKPSDIIDLEVPVWNVRARKTYEKAGFRLTDTYDLATPKGLQQVHCMVLEELAD